MPFLKVSSIWYLVSGIRNTKYKILNTKYRKTKGFTLIELLVVIAIIGILASFIVASFTTSQSKGRDGRRKADLDAIKKALELMKGDNSAQKYPGCSISTPCNAVSANFLPNMTTTYIRNIPRDPSTDTPYSYSPTILGAGCTSASCADAYTLTACLENKEDPQRFTVDGNLSPLDPCGGATADGKVGYRVQEP